MRYFTDCPQEGLAQCENAALIFNELHHAQEEDRHDEVVRLAEHIQEICPQCAHAATDRADALGRLGQHELAMQVVDDLFAAGLDSHPAVTERKGSLLALAGDFEGAIPWLEKSWATDPEPHRVNCHLASAHFLLERYKEALPYARRAWATQPGEELAMAVLIGVLVQLEIRPELADVLSRVSEVEWQDSSFVVTVASGFSKLGDTERTVEWCRKALDLDPEEEEALCMLGGVLYCEKRDYDSGLQVYSRLRDVSPDHGKSAMLSTARQVADDMGDLTHAVNLVVEARIYYPDDDDLRQYCQYLVDRLSGDVGKLAEETVMWRRRFEALSDDHSSLRRAVQELHQAAQPGSPLGVALVEGEGQSIEFIAGYPDNAHELAKEIAAFSTSNDGTVFLGVTDDGQVVGMVDLDEAVQRDALQQRISGVTTGIVRPSANVSVSFVPHRDKTVVRIFVPKGADPVYYVRNVPYLRHLDKSRPADPHEVEGLILRVKKPVSEP